jgi:hypothetical protein
MTASYPAAIATLATVADNVTEVDAAWANPVQDEIMAIEAALGINPQSSATTVVVRMAKILSSLGYLEIPDIEALTIASGSITTAKNRFTLANEGAAATDDLETITAPAVAGRVLIGRPFADAQVPTIKHNVGNIICSRGVDIVLGTAADLVILIYDAGLSKWMAMSTASATMTTGANTWTGVQTFSGGVKMPSATFTTSQTLDATRYRVLFDTTAGNLDCTLPDAATYSGFEYFVRKNVAANTLTLKCTGADTINGSATRTLTAALESVSVFSDGTGWII